MSSYITYQRDGSCVLLGGFERELLSFLCKEDVPEAVPLQEARILLKKASKGASQLTNPALEHAARGLVRQLESELPPSDVL